MNSIFVLTKTNFDFFKKPASIERCLSYIGNAPYWQIYGRVCYCHDAVPMYIIHNNVVLNNPAIYDDYMHVTNIKKPLYAITYYKVFELENIADQLKLHKENKNKREMYDLIKKYIQSIC